MPINTRNFRETKGWVINMRIYWQWNNRSLIKVEKELGVWQYLEVDPTIYKLKRWAVAVERGCSRTSVKERREIGKQGKFKIRVLCQTMTKAFSYWHTKLLKCKESRVRDKRKITSRTLFRKATLCSVKRLKDLRRAMVSSEKILPIDLKTLEGDEVGAKRQNLEGWEAISFLLNGINEHKFPPGRIGGRSR